MSTKGDIEAVRKDIANLLHQPEYDDGSAGPVLVRLAWHSAGTYDAETDTGGSNGAGMRYEAEGGDPANAGLQHARVFLEPVKAKHLWITYSDLWTLAGVVAIEEMGGPKIPWQPGRTDYVDDSKLPPRGRLPDAAKGSDHLRWAAVTAIDLALKGRGSTALPGSPISISASCCRCNGKKKQLRNGMEQFVNYDEDTETELMMLPTDIALTQDKDFRQYVELYARDKDRFFEDFSKVFAKLMELGLVRDGHGYVANSDNQKGGYLSAPKKKSTPGNPAKSTDDRVKPMKVVKVPEPAPPSQQQIRAASLPTYPENLSISRKSSSSNEKDTTQHTSCQITERLRKILDEYAPKENNESDVPPPQVQKPMTRDVTMENVVHATVRLHGHQWRFRIRNVKSRKLCMAEGFKKMDEELQNHAKARRKFENWLTCRSPAILVPLMGHGYTQNIRIAHPSLLSYCRNGPVNLTFRIMLAAFGGSAFIVLVAITILNSKTNAALVTTGVFTLAVAWALACTLRNERPQDIVLAVAAYAACLVVFVGDGTSAYKN
ncbi:hypothetical protein G7Y89_g2335 [Cudoniella acicularis]|uniref:Peroxidase n=1 Tax=Cudoniella acicularis TaxID=354080 RepID=A0A8H4RVI5_9HELO|nr:hypothetical protein G7Y89_g2335 [Cudoniella acicularis]